MQPERRWRIPEIDTRFWDEWVNYGMAELHIYLTKHAQFDEYIRIHTTEEPDESASEG